MTGILHDVLAWIGAAFLASLAAAFCWVLIRRLQDRIYYSRLEREQASDGFDLRSHLRVVDNLVEVDDTPDRRREPGMREEGW